MTESESTVGNRVLTILLIVAVFFLILTMSIGLPIYVRPFYYAHIGALGLPERTGWSYDTIKRAYDEMINFCTLYTPFSTGELAWSEEGMSHFADCRVLFSLNLGVMLVSSAYAIVAGILNRLGKIKLVRFRGHGAGFYAGIVAVVLPLVIGALAAIDFDRAFEVFHAVFFPGKDNWLFDPSTDQIIRILPEVFFRNCAILIGTGIVVSSVTLVTADCVGKRRRERAARAVSDETSREV